MYHNKTIMDYCYDLPKHIEIINITFVIDKEHNLYPSLDNLPSMVKCINVNKTVCLIQSKWSCGWFELCLFDYCKVKKEDFPDYHDIFPLKHKIKLPFDCKLLYKDAVYENIIKFEPYIYEKSSSCELF
jgi:hypothetical protein